mgnify:CR=1 FL=1
MAPLIGISLCLDTSGRFRPGRRYHYIDERYADAVAEAGGAAPVVGAPVPVVLGQHRLTYIVASDGDELVLVEDGA